MSQQDEVAAPAAQPKVEENKMEEKDKRPSGTESAGETASVRRSSFPSSFGCSSRTTGEDAPMLTDQATEHDAFEDAVESASVRSLTKRTLSVKSQPQTPGVDGPDRQDPLDKPSNDHEAVENKRDSTDEKNSQDQPETSPKTASISNRISRTSNLDVVDLDDETATDKPGKIRGTLRHRIIDSHNL